MTMVMMGAAERRRRLPATTRAYPNLHLQRRCHPHAATMTTCLRIRTSAAMKLHVQRCGNWLATICLVVAKP